MADSAKRIAAADARYRFAFKMNAEASRGLGYGGVPMVRRVRTGRRVTKVGA